jgi:hypothetical protein
MPLMLLPILDINLRQCLILDDQQILCILLFGSFCEIEASRDHNLPIDDHDLVMGNGVFGVDVGRNSGILD